MLPDIIGLMVKLWSSNDLPKTTVTAMNAAANKHASG